MSLLTYVSPPFDHRIVSPIHQSFCYISLCPRHAEWIWKSRTSWSMCGYQNLSNAVIQVKLSQLALPFLSCFESHFTAYFNLNPALLQYSYTI